jgi:hypothetical protein
MMPMELALYVVADLVVLFTLLLFALAPVAQDPGGETEAGGADDHDWLMASCWVI